MATITAATDATVLSPIMVLDYAYARRSRNQVLEPLGSEYPTVFLRKAASLSGTLSMLFSGASTARNAVTVLSRADRFSFAEPAVGEAWDFVTIGDVRNAKQEGTDLWVVSAEVREVEAL